MVKICIDCDAVVGNTDVYVPASGSSNREQSVNHCKFCGSKVIPVEDLRGT